MKKKLCFLVIVAVFLSFSQVSFAGEFLSKGEKTGDWAFKIPFGESGEYSSIVVKRAVDGDTLLLADGQRVRLIGIDTPEVHDSSKLAKDAQRSQQDKSTIKELGKQSMEFTRSLVEGKRVRLEFDVEKKDVYERVLAYVFLEDGTFVNAEIVKAGYASLMTYPPNVKYADLFLKLYQEARENHRGLWK
jgi:micrococcal nuclease